MENTDVDNVSSKCRRQRHAVKGQDSLKYIFNHNDQRVRVVRRARVAAASAEKMVMENRRI